MQNDYNPNEPFEGLSIKEWFKIIFRTRAQTLKQGDRVLNMMMEQNNVLSQEAEILRKSIGPLAKLVKQQHDALSGAKLLLDGVGETVVVVNVYNEIVEALAAAHDAL